VGVETDSAGAGSIQLRSTTVGTVGPTGAQAYSASDIRQTRPASLDDPTYLQSPGIQIGPGVDLVTKTAGGKPFSTYNYPTTLYYGLKGDLKNGGTSDGYMWPGTQAATNNTFPDPSLTVPAFYRVQQPFLLSGFIVYMSIGPGTGYSTTVTVRRTPFGGAIADVPGFTLTFNNSETFKSYYNSSQTFGAKDLIHVHITRTGGNSNTTHDITVQLDCF
jgi:hypothetical protein